jgi:hypothetical protein
MTAVYSALSAVSAGVYGALNVQSLLTLAPGGVGDDIAQGTSYPFVLYQVSEAPIAQMGGRPGTGRTLAIALRLYIYTQYAGMSQAQAIAEECIALLAHPPSVSGFNSWAIFHDETVPVGRDMIAGVPVNELVVNLRLFVTETP